MLRAIFISPAFDSDRFDALTNTQWYLDRHEWEFSITPVPLIILLFGLIVLMKRLRKDTARPIPAPGRFLHLTAIILLLLLPVGLNCYTPGWNQFLKQLPVIGSSSTLIRWAIIYIPVVILLAALVLDRIIPRGRLQSAAAAVCLGAVILLNLAADRTYYHAQGYRAEPVQQAYHDVRAGSWTPEIRFVMVYRDGNGQILTPGHRNDTITLGGSQLFCYEALFGYRLEAFPFGDLHPGPVTAETNGRLNLKNPACYVWPGENNCRPGDHFSVAARAAANSFSRYRPFDFKLPLRQTIANWLNGITLVATLGFLLIRGFSRIHRKLS